MMSVSTTTVYLFHRPFDLTLTLYTLSLLCCVIGTVFGWLAYQHWCYARRFLMSQPVPRAERLSRLAFEFDLFRGFWFAMFSWCILAIVMALEPHYWMATVEDQYSVFAGWLVIATGFAFGLLVFAGGRVQEHIGWHPFQELAEMAQRLQMRRTTA